MSDRIDRAVAKSILAAEGAAIGGAIGGPAGATVGAVTGLIVGDATTVFPLDMIAIPAYHAYMIAGVPAMQVYIRAGETLLPTGGNVEDVQEVMEAVAVGREPIAARRIQLSPTATCDEINHTSILGSSAGVIEDGAGPLVDVVVSVKDDVHTIGFKEWH